MTKKSEYDVLIIGGGPAGMAAAIWCEDLGISSAILEMRPQMGGQLHRIFNPISNYPGVICATGSDLFDRFADHLEKCDSVDRIEAEVVKVQVEPLTIQTADGLDYRCRALVIATGVEKRRLGIRGEIDLAGKGVLYSGAKEREAVAGKRVAIVGGGDAALENALILANFAQHVYVIHRGSQFSARSEFVELARGRPNIEFLMGQSVQSIIGQEIVEGVEMLSANGQHSLLTIDNLLIRIGVTPNSSIFEGIVSRNESGYIVVEAECATDVPGIYAIGDVTNQIAPTISGAVGQAATSIKTVFKNMN